MGALEDSLNAPPIGSLEAALEQPESGGALEAAVAPAGPTTDLSGLVGGEKTVLGTLASTPLRAASAAATVPYSMLMATKQAYTGGENIERFVGGAKEVGKGVVQAARGVGAWGKSFFDYAVGKDRFKPILAEDPVQALNAAAESAGIPEEDRPSVWRGALRVLGGAYEAIGAQDVLEGFGEEVAKYKALPPESKSIVANSIAMFPETVIETVGEFFVTAPQDLLLGGAVEKVGAKAGALAGRGLTGGMALGRKVKAKMGARATEANTAVKRAEVRLASDAVIKESGKAAKSSKTTAILSEDSTSIINEASQDILEANIAKAETKIPENSPLFKTPDALIREGLAEVPGAQEGVVKKAVIGLKRAVVNDPLMRVPTELQEHLAKITNASNYGQMKAINAMTELERGYLTLDNPYFLNEKIVRDLKWNETVAARAKKVALEYGLKPEVWWKRFVDQTTPFITTPTKTFVQKAMMNNPIENPVLVKAYTAVGEIITNLKEWHPRLHDVITEAETSAVRNLSDALVNPALGSKQGIASDLFKEAKIPAEKIGETRALALENAFEQAQQEGLLEDVLVRLENMLGNRAEAEQALNIMKQSQVYLRRTNEVDKMSMGMSLMEGLHMHQTYNANAAFGPAGAAGVLKKRLPASAKQRKGFLQENQELMNMNYREILQTEIAATQSAKVFNEGLRDMIKAGAYKFVNKAESIPAGMVELELKGMDRYTLRSVLAHLDTGLDRTMTDKLNQLLEGTNLLADNVDELISNAMVSLGDAKKIAGIIGRKRLIVNKEVNEYLQAMQQSKYYSVRESVEQGWLKISAEGELFEGLEAGKKVFDYFKPAMVGLDFAGMGFSVGTVIPNMLTELGPRATYNIIKQTHKIADADDMKYLLDMAKWGIKSPGIKFTADTASHADSVYALSRRLPVLNRMIGYSERTLFRNDLNNMGVMDRLQLETYKYVTNNAKEVLQGAKKHPATREMFNEMTRTFDEIFNTDFLEQLLNTKYDADIHQRVRLKLDKIFGAYNPAALTATEKKFAKNIFMFYGMFRGTGTAWLSAPFRHPLRSVYAPFYVMDKLNYALSGNHMWENERGRRVSIKVDFEKLGWGRFNQTTGKMEYPAPLYFKPLTQYNRIAKTYGFENIIDMGEAEEMGAYDLAFNYLAHGSKDLLANALLRTAVFPTIPGRYGMQALEASKKFDDLNVTDKRAVAHFAIENALQGLSWDAQEAYKEMKLGGFRWDWDTLGYAAAKGIFQTMTSFQLETGPSGRASQYAGKKQAKYSTLIRPDGTLNLGVLTPDVAQGIFKEVTMSAAWKGRDTNGAKRVVGTLMAPAVDAITEQIEQALPSDITLTESDRQYRRAAIRSWVSGSMP